MNYGLYKSQCPTEGPYVTITRTPPSGSATAARSQVQAATGRGMKKKRSTGVVDLQQEPEGWKRLS